MAPLCRFIPTRSLVQNIIYLSIYTSILIYIYENKANEFNTVRTYIYLYRERERISAAAAECRCSGDGGTLLTTMTGAKQYYLYRPTYGFRAPHGEYDFSVYYQISIMCVCNTCR